MPTFLTSIVSTRLPRCLGAFVLLSCTLHAGAVSISLAPQHALGPATSGGADGLFIRIDPAWHGSTVLWNEAAQPGQQFANGAAGGGYQTIGSFSWGRGLWGRADWSAVMGGTVPVVERWSGLSGEINFGNGCYNDSFSSQWGSARPLPVDDHGPCLPADDDLHGNWIAHFKGFIRIEQAGDYNFSVLYDDGFFLSLTGEGGRTLEIGQDFLNPRDREGFDHDLALTPGFYGFELGVWNRLQAGVVDLRASRDGGNTWTLVQPESLLPASALPLPPSWLLVAGLLPLAGMIRRQRRS